MHRHVLRGRPARVLAIIAGTLAAALALAGGGVLGSGELKGMAAPDVGGGINIMLPAYGEGLKGQPKELRADYGKLLLLYFGYLSCPDVCPTTMSALAVAVRSLPAEDRRSLEVAMVTGDPARDSGQDIVDYLKHFFNDLPVYGLRTADSEQLTRAEDAFGAASEIDPHKPGEAYTVSHTAFLYAVDHTGRVLLMWPFGSLSEDISSDLKVLLERQRR